MSLGDVTATAKPKKELTVPDPRNIAEIRGQVDVGILTIRPDEFTAVLERFGERTMVVGGNNLYDFSTIEHNGSATNVVMTRILEAGGGRAQHVARDMIEDLNPRWILLVGIAGGVPDSEYSLGDVLVAKRLHDFSVSAVSKGETTYATAGGSMHTDVDKLLAHLPAMKDALGDWSSEGTIGRPRPSVDLKKSNFYGNEDWQSDVRNSLKAAFDVSRNPVLWEGAVADGSVLMKDTDVLESWMQNARDIRMVEMESAGVFWAARSSNCRVLAIRGLSDIVGFKRGSEWTDYACQTAASFTRALVGTGILKQITDTEADAPKVMKPARDRPAVASVELTLDQSINDFNGSEFLQLLRETTQLPLKSVEIVGIRPGSTVVELRGDEEDLIGFVDHLNDTRETVEALAKSTGLRKYSWESEGTKYEIAVDEGEDEAVLAAERRLALVQALTSLMDAEFEQLLFAANPPAGVIPNGVAQGIRAAALLEWATKKHKVSVIERLLEHFQNPQ